PLPTPRPPTPPLFPYTTLFRSPERRHRDRGCPLRARVEGGGRRPARVEALGIGVGTLACEVLVPVREREQVGERPRRPHSRDLLDRKSTRLNSSHVSISYAAFC